MESFQDTLTLTTDTEKHVTVFRTVTDIDSNVYRIIKISNQWWMSENLRITQYRNGDDIPIVTINSEWSELSTGARCAYNNDENNLERYGYLYNWYAVNDSRNLAPNGWHVPTDAEWKELEMHLGMSQVAADSTLYRGTDEGGKLKETGTTHWLSPNIGATNEIGFSALPGGFRSDTGVGHDLGYLAYYWSSTEHDSNTAVYRNLHFGSSKVCRSDYSKQTGFSVRLIRD
ncbi:hypothetical protein BVY01_00310 [bacterium I07]|nr:hypothetical protein BVY01_00310 [bacterium I07]